VTTWKKLALYAVALALVLAWGGLVAGFAIGVSKTVWLVLVTIAAVATEVSFWVVAAILGISVVQARGRIWAGLRRAFTRDPA
jgi:hypothetical protein